MRLQRRLKAFIQFCSYKIFALTFFFRNIIYPFSTRAIHLDKTRQAPDQVPSILKDLGRRWSRIHCIKINPLWNSSPLRTEHEILLLTSSTPNQSLFANLIFLYFKHNFMNLPFLIWKIEKFTHTPRRYNFDFFNK